MRCVLSMFLTVDSDGAYVISAGRLFHMLAAATENERSTFKMTKLKCICFWLAVFILAVIFKLIQATVWGCEFARNLVF